MQSRNENNAAFQGAYNACNSTTSARSSLDREDALPLLLLPLLLLLLLLPIWWRTKTSGGV